MRSLFLELYLIKCFSDDPDLPEINLGFAISARAAAAYSNFKKMKDTIRNIIDKFGQGKIRYSVITFGTTPSVYLNFSESFPSDDDLTRHLNNVPLTQGQASLDKALEEAKKLFDATTRQNVKNVLVVMMDKSSTSNSKDVEEGSALLKTENVRIISVSLGNESDPTELQKVASSVDDVIKANELVTPKRLAKAIMDKVREGELYFK